MNRTIELAKIVADGDMIRYEIHDNSGLNLLQKKKVDAWIRFYHADRFGFDLNKLPESVLAIPITLYLLRVTWLYGVDLVLNSIDKMLYENVDAIRDAYSQIFGSFEDKWRGEIRVKEIVENKLPDSQYKNIVFFSGGIDAIHAGINNPGRKSVLVSIPDVENKSQAEGPLREEKFRLIEEFSKTIGSNWLLISNNFNKDIFNSVESIVKRNHIPVIRQYAAVGKYVPNLCSVAPFAYALGIKSLIMGSGFEQIENEMKWALDGTNPIISNAFKFAGISFAEQDGLYTRRSLKVKNIVSTFDRQNIHIKIWACFDNSKEQCGECTKCVRTQLNILCANENPKDWGFALFDEKYFSRFIHSYRWFEETPGWVWDIVDSIDDTHTYPYCNELLHWLKQIGYKKYYNRTLQVRKLMKLSRVFKVHKYPHYASVVCRRLIKR